MNNNIPTLRLRRGKEESLDRFHPWVFSGALVTMPDDIDEGDLVYVETSDGRRIGTGHFQIGSIAVRMLTFSDEPIDGDFYRRRLQEALKLRQSLGLIRPDNNRKSVV